MLNPALGGSMTKFFSFIALLAFTIPTFAADFQPAADDLNSATNLELRCPQELPTDAQLKSTDFRWGFSLPELLQKWQEIYTSNKRLPTRAYWDSQKASLVLPYSTSRGGNPELPFNFLHSVRRHVEVAFAADYIDALIFPDMGHSHFLIPDAKYKNEYKFPVSQMAQTYEQFFNDPELLVVYHTAEQLTITTTEGKLLPDRRSQWRFFSRNLIGDNLGLGRLQLAQNPTHKHNTTDGLPGYNWWGAGFNISANKKGCIAYRRHGSIEYFDLSLEDLTSDVTGDEYQIDPSSWLQNRH